MVQAGEDLCFSLEPRKAIRISRKRLGQDLERDLPVQLRIGGLIDLAHAPLADEGGDVVMGDARSDFQRHSDSAGVIDADQPRVYGVLCNNVDRNVSEHRLQLILNVRITLGRVFGTTRGCQ